MVFTIVNIRNYIPEIEIISEYTCIIRLFGNKFRDNAFFYKAINSVSVQVSKTFSLLRKARSLLLPINYNNVRSGYMDHIYIFTLPLSVSVSKTLIKTEATVLLLDCQCH